MSDHAVVIVGAGPTGLMLAGELALAGVDVAILERRPDQELHGARALGISARTIEVLDQRGIAGRFLAAGQAAQVTRCTASSAGRALRQARRSIGSHPRRSDRGR